MDLYQLRIVRELSELGSLSAVAARLSVTTSAVSQQLRALQDEMGEQLVAKSGRTLVLNEAGRVLAAAAVQVLASMSDAELSVQRHFSDGRGEVSVAALHSAGLAIFPKLLRRMDAESGPRVICSDTDVTVDTFARLVADVDLVIAHRLPWGNPWPASIAVTPLVFEPLDVAMPAGHRLAGAAEVRPADLADEDWISVQESFPLASALHALGAAAGATLRVRHRLNEFPIVVSLVAAGQGVALLPRYMGNPDAHPGVVLRPLAGIEIGRQIDILSRPEVLRKKSAVTVIAAIRDVLRVPASERVPARGQVGY